MAHNFDNIKDLSVKIGVKEDQVHPAMPHLITAMNGLIKSMLAGIGDMHCTDIRDLTDALNKTTEVYDRIRFKRKA